MSVGGIIGGDRRRPGMPPELLGRVLLVWLLIAVLMLAANAIAIWQMRFPDPDDTLRLVEVRDWLAGQGWFDLTPHRSDPAAGGVAMPWSRLVDVPIAAVIVVLKPLLGQGPAELVALILVPLVTLGCVLLLVARIAYRLFDEEVAGLACLACAVAVPLAYQLRPMRIDHHGWQVVAMLVAANGLMARDARRGGWAIGTGLAVWLAISIEGLPLAACFVAVTAWKWLRCRADRWWMVHTMVALATVSAALFAATRGFGELGQHCDAISPMHLAVFAWGAGITAGNAWLEPHPKAFTLGGMALAVVGAGLIVWRAAPQCTGGAFVALDPLVRDLWYAQVLEGRPIWLSGPTVMLQSLALPVLGLLAVLRLIAPSSDWLRRWWMDYALLLVAALVIAVFVARASAAACALAAVPMGWQLREWIRAARNARAPRRRVLVLAGVVLALAPALPLSLLLTATPGHAALGPDDSPVRVSNCKIDAAAAQLRRLPPSDILAPLDIGPKLLYATSHRVVATGHHRAAAAMHDVIAAFLADSGAAHAVAVKHGIDYVAICPDLAEAMEYEAIAPSGFAARLRHGNPPAWLRPVPLAGNGGFRLWRVVG